MANYSQMYVTNRGINLYAKVQAGIPLNFTRMQIGSGRLVSGQDPKILTALIAPLFYAPINSITHNLDTAFVKGIVDNSTITVSTYTCEIGLFAQDPDLGEILYAYANAADKGDYIPPISSGPFSRQFQLDIAASNSTTVTATIPSNTYTTVVDFQTHVTDGTQHVEYLPTSNVGNAYSVTSAKLTTLTDGYPLKVKFNAASTGAITVNPNSLRGIPVLDYFGNPVTNVREDLIANLAYEINSDSFQLQGKGGGGDSTGDDLRLGKKATVDSGPIVGTVITKSGITYMPTTTDQIIGISFEDGTCKVAGDSDHVAGNIRAGVTDFAVNGTFTADATATAAKILSGATAGINGSMVTGTIPDKTSSATVYTVSTVDQAISIGYTDGAMGSVKVKGEAALLATNLLLSTVIGPVTGTAKGLCVAGTNVIVSTSSVGSIPTTMTAYTKVKEIAIGLKGTIRVTFTAQQNNSTAGGAHAQIYVNGVARGVERECANGTNTNPVVYSEDITVLQGDLIQIYGKVANATYSASITNLNLGVDSSLFAVNL